jgi:hypothetical protein
VFPAGAHAKVASCRSCFTTTAGLRFLLRALNFYCPVFALPLKELLPAEATARSRFCCFHFVPCTPAVLLFWSWLRSLCRLRCSRRFCPPLAQSFSSPEVRRAPRCLSGSVLHLSRRGRVPALPPSVCSSCFTAVCPAGQGCHFSHVGCCSLRWHSPSADGSLCSIPQQHVRLTLPLKNVVQLFVRF